MNNLGFALDAAWRVLIVGLLLGAGLPVVFALGIRQMAHGRGGAAEAAAPDGTIAEAHPAARVVGLLCFMLVVAAVALAITFIVATGFGKTLSFEHIYPTLADKH